MHLARIHFVWRKGLLCVLFKNTEFLFAEFMTGFLILYQRKHTTYTEKDEKTEQTFIHLVSLVKDQLILTVSWSFYIELCSLCNQLIPNVILTLEPLTHNMLLENCTNYLFRFFCIKQYKLKIYITKMSKKEMQNYYRSKVQKRVSNEKQALFT